VDKPLSRGRFRDQTAFSGPVFRAENGCATGFGTVMAILLTPAYWDVAVVNGNVARGKPGPTSRAWALTGAITAERNQLS